MALGHVHRWEEARRIYTPSMFQSARAAGATRFNVERFADQEAADRALHGFTTIELRCSECGDVKAVLALGDLTRHEAA